MLRPTLPALLGAILLLPAGPAAAQADHSYGPGTLSVTYGANARCRPAVTAASARPDSASVTVTLTDSARQNITVTVIATVTAGGQSYRFEGGRNLPTGSGAVSASITAGGRLPANLNGSRMSVDLFYCQVNAPVAPPPSGDR
ncbi:hypothetical protein [Rubritepida flocculans]|uniref:hypothetical protein n=1 Tax=Rubritepida flocculans TaxID=182403 RepID=UPI0004119162|nr:hypothetical protein [Rubritepida flocculans]